MVVIDYVGNTNSERRQLEAFQATVDNKIAKIEQVLTNLGSVWHDSQSSDYINKSLTQIEALKEANAKCKIEAENYFAEIQRILNIYNL